MRDMEVPWPGRAAGGRWRSPDPRCIAILHRDVVVLFIDVGASSGNAGVDEGVDDMALAGAKLGAVHAAHGCDRCPYMSGGGARLSVLDGTSIDVSHSMNARLVTCAHAPRACACAEIY